VGRVPKSANRGANREQRLKTRTGWDASSEAGDRRLSRQGRQGAAAVPGDVGGGRVCPRRRRLGASARPPYASSDSKFYRTISHQVKQIREFFPTCARRIAQRLNPRSAG